MGAALESLAKLIESFARLIGVLSWPAIMLILIFQFRASIRDFINNIGEGSFKGFGFEAFAKRKFEAVAAIAAAQAKSEFRSSSTEASSSGARNISESVIDSEKFITERTLRGLDNKFILWVDDKPENNNYERKAFRALGVRIWSVRSNAEAINLIKDDNNFDVIVSDMSRPEGQLAGYDLISQLRSIGYITPIIIYSGSNTPEQASMARRNGAFGSTADAARLVELVSDAVNFSSARR
ncbi:response regulator [Methylobacterium sp. Leaf469]|uniref:response regulator n=1 Tax=Methylobacterium sp. Leaf469 TaxID=1736387 RepID=UPI0009EC5027|nr:response regulator [Methylobacterium sp. Leaf469]